MPEIAKYVNHGAEYITPAILEKLLRQLPLWKMEFSQIRAPQFPHLIDQLDFLADVVEDFAEGVDKELPYTAVATAAFALMYAHKKVDIIPDFVHSLGHADDSSVVRAALIQFETAFAKYAKRHNLNWTRVTSNP